MKPFPAFFSTALLGAFYIFVIDLSIFFDRNNKSFSLDKIISKLQLSSENLTQIEKIREAQKENIKKLKDKRDKSVAHFELGVDRSEINSVIFKECEELLEATQEIFKILTMNFNRSVWAWDNFPTDISHEVRFLLDNLEKGQSKRLEEIKAKWGV